MRIAIASGLDSGRTPQLEGFSDADFAADKAEMKLMTIEVLLLNVMAVSWSARKKGGVSLSSLEEDEFFAASEDAREILGLHEMLCKVGIKPALPLQLHEDNSGGDHPYRGQGVVAQGKSRRCAAQITVRILSPRHHRR